MIHHNRRPMYGVGSDPPEPRSLWKQGKTKSDEMAEINAWAWLIDIVFLLGLSQSQSAVCRYCKDTRSLFVPYWGDGLMLPGAHLLALACPTSFPWSVDMIDHYIPGLELKNMRSTALTVSRRLVLHVAQVERVLEVEWWRGCVAPPIMWSCWTQKAKESTAAGNPWGGRPRTRSRILRI